MKGLVLAGGSNTRFYPITKGVSKRLLLINDNPEGACPITVLMPTRRTRWMNSGDSLEIVQADSQFPMRMVETVDRILSHLPDRTSSIANYLKIRRISGFFIVNPKAERTIIRYLIVSLQTNQELPRSGNASAR